MTDLEAFRDSINDSYESLADRKPILEAAFPGLRKHAEWKGVQADLGGIYSTVDAHLVELGLPTGLTPPPVVVPPDPPIEPVPPVVVGIEPPVFVPVAQRGVPAGLVFATTHDLNQWGTVKPKSDTKLARAHIVESDWIAMSHAKNDGLLVNFEMENCLLEDCVTWFKRWYRAQRGLLFRNCTFRKLLKEHVDYWNMAGYGPNPSGDPDVTFAGRWIGCLFQDIGSQGLQIVLEESRWAAPNDPNYKGKMLLRINETTDYNFDATPGGWLSVESCSFINCGANRSWGRASYAISFFSTRNHARVCDTIIDASMQESIGARGAILFEGVPAYEDYRALFDPAFKGHIHSYFPRRGVVERCEIHGRNYDRPPLKVHRSMESVEIRDTLFDCDGGQRNIMIASDTRAVSVTGCEGPGNIVDEDGKTLETIKNGYERKV